MNSCDYYCRAQGLLGRTRRRHVVRQKRNGYEVGRCLRARFILPGNAKFREARARVSVPFVFPKGTFRTFNNNSNNTNNNNNNYNNNNNNNTLTGAAESVGGRLRRDGRRPRAELERKTIIDENARRGQTTARE